MIHPDDTILQQYAYAEMDASTASIHDHVATCTVCSMKVEVYRQIEIGLSQSQLPVLDEVRLFNQIKPKLKPYKSFSSVIPWQFTVILFGIGFLLFWSPNVLFEFDLPPFVFMMISCLTGLFILEYIYSKSTYNNKINAF